MLNITAYHSPTTLHEAVDLLATEGRTIIAGGTDLLVNPRYMVGVREVVDIRALNLNYIREEQGELRIGAATTMRTVALNPTIQQLASGILARGAAVCGSPNIRNMATLAGNVASALPSADTPPSLLALDAQVVLLSTRGERTVPLNAFFVGPARTVREHELIRELRIPVPSAKEQVHGGFYKIGRTAEDISVVNAAATLAIQNNRVTGARIVLGAVAPVPLRILAAEEALIGQLLTEELFQQIAAIVRAAVRPISDQRATADYRQRMSGIAIVRALRQAAGMTPQKEEWHHA